MPNTDFNLTSLIVLISIAAAGLLLIDFYARREKRKRQKKLQSRYPSARKEAIPDMDITERFYSD